MFRFPKSYNHTVSLLKFLCNMLNLHEAKNGLAVETELHSPFFP
jgi:hypothetical protein